MSIDRLLELSAPFALQVILTLALVLVYVVADRIATPKLTEGADQGNFKEGAADQAIAVARLIIGIACLLGLALVWGIEFTSIFVFAGTTLTLIGVAFFASWSLLSNVTAYFILLLHPTFRRGTFIRILDADNYVEGYIADITLFNMRLISESREIIVYPNNLALARPAVINPRKRGQVVGKIIEAKDETEVDKPL